MSLAGNWSYPTAIRFGAGRISEIADACRESGISKPLLVTDRGLADLDITRRTLDLMDAAGLGRAHLHLHFYHSDLDLLRRTPRAQDLQHPLSPKYDA